MRGLYDARPRMGILPPDRWIERNNIFFSDRKGDNPLVDTVAIVPDATSRSVKLGFRERLKTLVTQARRLTPEDFRITEEDAAETPGMSLEEMRQNGCRPESVGPSGRVAAGGQYKTPICSTTSWLNSAFRPILN